MDIKCDFIFNGNILQIDDDIEKNYIAINGTEYFVSYIDPITKSNKGGNSFVFKLFQAQTFNEDAEPVSVMKISKRKEKFKNNRTIESVKNLRFRQEVAALYDCKSKNVGNVIEIDTDGNLICRRNKDNDYEVSFPFYLMEYAKFDLKSFLEEENEDYFLGSVVVFKENNKQNIIDGQQRTTTLSLFIRALYEKALSQKSNDISVLLNHLSSCLWDTNQLNGDIDYSKPHLKSDVAIDSDNELLEQILSDSYEYDKEKIDDIIKKSKSNYEKNYLFFDNSAKISSIEHFSKA